MNRAMLATRGLHFVSVCKEMLLFLFVHLSGLCGRKNGRSIFPPSHQGHKDGKLLEHALYRLIVHIRISYGGLILGLLKPAHQNWK